MKFKVGDKVKIIKNTGAEFYDKYIGKTSVIQGFNHHHYQYPYSLPLKTDDGDSTSGWCDDELQLIKKAMPKKVNFILQYELDEDPIEEFTTMKQVESRIKELAEDEDLKEDSIKVYEIKSVKTVTLNREITIKYN